MLRWGETRKEGLRRRLLDRARWRQKLMRRAVSEYPRPYPMERYWRPMATWDDVWARRREYVSRYYANRKICDGRCCRNYRRTAKAMTPQELRAELDARTQCAELGLGVPRSRFRPRTG